MGCFFLPDWRAAVIHADIRRALWLDVARGNAALGGRLVPYIGGVVACRVLGGGPRAQAGIIGGLVKQRQVPIAVTIRH